MEHANLQDTAAPKGFWRSRYAIGLLFMGGVAAYFLLNEHRAHFLGALPFMLLLACPLMHLFMHHGHAGHGSAHPGQHGATSDARTSAALQPGQPGEQR